MVRGLNSCHGKSDDVHSKSVKQEPIELYGRNVTRCQDVAKWNTDEIPMYSYLKNVNELSDKLGQGFCGDIMNSTERKNGDSVNTRHIAGHLVPGYPAH